MRIRYDGDERNGQAGLGHVTGRNTAPISAFLLSPIYKSVKIMFPSLEVWVNFRSRHPQISITYPFLEEQT